MSLDLLRTNPLAAGFDQVLGAVGYGHKPLAIDRRDVACVEITVRVERCIILAIIAGDRRPTLDEEMPRSLTVLRNRLPVVAHQSQIDTHRWPALPDFEGVAFLGRLPCRCPARHVHGADGGEFGHAPTVNNLHAQYI